MKVLLVIFAVLIFSGCKDASEFIETNCELLESGGLLVQFKNDKATRSVTINPEANVITFKGTTYQDMKWATELDKVKSFNINRNNMFAVHFKNGKEMKFGTISATCKEKTGEFLGVLLQ